MSYGAGLIINSTWLQHGPNKDETVCQPPDRQPRQHLPPFSRLLSIKQPLYFTPAKGGGRLSRFFSSALSLRQSLNRGERREERVVNIVEPSVIPELIAAICGRKLGGDNSHNFSLFFVFITPLERHASSGFFFF